MGETRICILARVALALFVMGTAGRAYAQPAPAAETQQRAPRWSLTTNLAFDILPVINVSAERRLSGKSGLSARAGIGRVTIHVPIGDDSTNTVVEIGAAYHYYLLGDWMSGLELGGDVRYVNAGSGKLLNIQNAVAVGAFVGYKKIFSFGLVIDVRGGGAIAFGDADNVVVPLIFIGAGWSL